MNTTLHTGISTELLPPRLAVLGNIKIGGLGPKRTSAKGNEFQAPVKYDHFRVTHRQRGTDGNYLPYAEVHEVVGDRPVHLDVRLFFPEPAQNFHARMVHYEGKALSRECDGETSVDCSTGVSGVCSRRQGKECKCKPYGRLVVALEAAPVLGGLFAYRTTSWETVNNLQSALRLFKKQFGSLQGLPLRMVLYPAEHQVPDSRGGTVTATSYKVGLVLRASWEEAASAALEFHRHAQLARREILQIASGVVTELDAEDLQDAGEIEREFFPSTGARKAIGSGLSGVARMNRVVAEPAGEEDGDDGTGDEEPVDRKGELLQMAAARADQLTMKAQERMTAAAQSNDPDRIDAALQWLQENTEEPEPTVEELPGSGRLL